MRLLLNLILIWTMLSTINTATACELCDGFVYLNEVDPTIKVSLRYSGEDNFIGQPITGYLSSRVVVTIKAAQALHNIQNELHKEGLSLLIYDAYRPQQAVDHFARWSEDINDQKMKPWFYPEINKANAFELGYIAKKSGHSRGSTVDLTIIPFAEQPKKPVYTYRKLPDGKVIPFIEDGSIDMGSSFDLFSEVSHVNYTNLPESAKINRQFLQNIMNKYGFVSYDKEWWHFTLKDEPFPDQYFNFPIH